MQRSAGGDEAGIVDLGLILLEVVDSMHPRKARMAEEGDAFVALPGGQQTWNIAPLAVDDLSPEPPRFPVPLLRGGRITVLASHDAPSYRPEIPARS